MIKPPGVGTSVQLYAEYLVECTKEQNKEVSVMFNEMLLIAEPRDTAKKIVGRWLSAFKAQARKTAKTPEDRARRAKNKKYKNVQIQKSHKLLREARYVDFSSVRAALQFLNCCVIPMGYCYTGHLGKLLVPYLETYAQYEKLESVPPEDHELCGKLLVANALSDLRTGYGIHEAFTAMYERWCANAR